MRPIRFGAIPAALFAIVVCLSGGCGSAPGSALSGGTGRAVMTVKWPPRSRLIPDASNSIRVNIVNGSAIVASAVMPRPATTGQGTVSFDTLPTGDLTVLVAACPQTDGSGTPQAEASAPLTIQSGQITQFSVTMASTIDHLEATPSSFSMAVGQNVQITATAKNTAGDIVLTSPNKIQWSSSDTTIATVDGTGKIAGIAAGSAQVTVTETESGKSAGIAVTVTSTGGPEYDVTDLGSLATDTDYSEGSSINSAGAVAGASLITGVSHAFLWQNGRMSDLGVLNSADSYAYAINDSGVVVGTSNNDAVVWQNGSLTDLGSPTGAYTTAYGVNAGGQIVGTSFDTNGAWHAYLWQNGTPTSLETAALSNTEAYGINRSGQIVGGAVAANGSTNGEHAAMWQNGQMTDLGTIGSYHSVARAINDNGQIVGQIYDDTLTHGFILQNGQMTDLGVLSTDLSTTEPTAINGAGIVVGTASSSTDSRAFRRRTDGVMQDLNDLIAPASGWTLLEAHGINDQGQIVGNGVLNGLPHAFLLTPIGRGARLASRSGAIHPAARRHYPAVVNPKMMRYRLRHVVRDADRMRLLRQH